MLSKSSLWRSLSHMTSLWRSLSHMTSRISPCRCNGTHSAAFMRTVHWEPIPCRMRITLSTLISEPFRNQRHYFSSQQSAPKGATPIDIQTGQGNSPFGELLEDADLNGSISDEYFLPSEGHSVFIIQLDERFRRKEKLTTPELQLEEACALVQSLPHWAISQKAIYSVKQPNKKYVFGSGTLQTITQQIRQSQNTTAVFVGVSMLTGLQLATLQGLWKVPVYDRYTLVLQIFKIRARTAEARLQVALAELPFYRSRLVGMHSGSLDQQRGGLSFIGGSGEKHLELRHRLLHEKSVKIRKALTDLRSKRELLRQERKRKCLPVIAVVGYTNAGKTSLIKAMTGEEAMTPRDQLFATLDVTVHAGYLPNKLRVLFTDTVGFISDIPIGLVESFAATLEDIASADVLVHVRDASHPDRVAQKENVLHTLRQLSLPDNLMEGIIEALNKVDLLSSEEIAGASDIDEDAIKISATQGQGLMQLRTAIEEKVIESTGRMEKRIKVPQNGSQLSWLYREADVKHVTSFPADPEYLLIDAVMTAAIYAKFCRCFKKKS